MEVKVHAHCRQAEGTVSCHTASDGSPHDPYPRFILHVRCIPSYLLLHINLLTQKIGTWSDQAERAGPTGIPRWCNRS